MKKILVFLFCFYVSGFYAQTLRAPAVPLLTFDPYFSCWSFGDKLNESNTKHWTGKDHSLTGLIRIDGVTYRFMGKGNEQGVKLAEQTKLTITSTQSIYEFLCGTVELKISFISPLLINNLELLSRPVGYVSYEIAFTNRLPHDVQILFGVSPELAVNKTDQPVTWESKKANGLEILKTGTVSQQVLATKGDDVRIDWGYLYLATVQHLRTTASIQKLSSLNEFVLSGKISEDKEVVSPAKVNESPVLLTMIRNHGKIEKPVSDKILIGYDDIYSIQYFGQNLRPYWNRDNKHSMEGLLKQAWDDYDGTLLRCQENDRMICADAEGAGGVEYSQLCVLAYRQAIAAHKLVAAPDGTPLFLSKENFSNGSIATVDVTFPSAPLFLAYNTTLLKGMLEPIFYYYESGKWTKKFPAHDIGTYPIANGQTYSEDMPVEESGNMLILTAAITMADGNADYARKHMKALSKWVQYLRVYGLDPGTQLCTDDFAGHLAHNTHLSIKAILGLKCYAYLTNRMGMKDSSAKYHEMAAKYVQEWIKTANDGDHFRLAFDQKNTWSQKYNLVWDKALGLNIFPPSVFQKELRYYLTKQNKYGLPLDNRETYGKSDWMVWTAAIARDNDTYTKLLHPVWLYVNETPDRIPLSDWHNTITGKSVGFRARSVVGAYWIRVMEEKLSRKINK